MFKNSGLLAVEVVVGLFHMVPIGGVGETGFADPINICKKLFKVLWFAVPIGSTAFGTKWEVAGGHRCGVEGGA